MPIVTLHLLAKALGASVDVVTGTVSIIRISVVTIGVSVVTGFSISLSGPFSTKTPGSSFEIRGLDSGPLEVGIVVNSGKTISIESMNWSNGSNWSNFSFGRSGIFFSRPLANALDASVGVRSCGTGVTSDTSSQGEAIVGTVEAIVSIGMVTVESISGFGLSIGLSRSLSAAAEASAGESNAFSCGPGLLVTVQTIAIETRMVSITVVTVMGIGLRFGHSDSGKSSQQK